MKKLNKKIGIVGSRRRNGFGDLEDVHRAFMDIYEIGDTIVSGGCPTGADWFAEIFIKMYNIPKIIHLPDKSKLDGQLLKINPRAAYAVINYARNELIARDSDILIACVAEDRRGGTEDTIRKFKKHHPNGKLILV